MAIKQASSSAALWAFSQQSPRPLSVHCFEINSEDTFRKTCLPDNILILYSRRDGKYFCPRVWDVRKKEPFSLLSSQVNSSDPTQQKFKLQQDQSLKLIGPGDPRMPRRRPALQAPGGRRAFSHPRRVAVPLSSAWLCCLRVLAEYLPWRSSVENTKAAKVTTRREDTTGPHGKEEKSLPPF